MVGLSFDIIISKSITKTFVKFLEDLAQYNGIDFNKEHNINLFQRLYRLPVKQIFLQNLVPLEEPRALFREHPICQQAALVVPA